MKTRIALLALAALWCFGCIHGASSEADQKLIEKSEAAYAAGDFSTALRLVLPLAQKGNADAEFAVGLLTLRDSAKETVNSKAAILLRDAWSWIKKAAAHGNNEAIMHVADAYKNGWYGFPKNQALAQRWRETLTDKSKVADCLAWEGTLRLPEPVPQANPDDASTKPAKK